MPAPLPSLSSDPVDLFVIGGGINGCGIARDAAGRGLSVVLAEKGDLAGATSSASTKLFHGGLRYLEYFEFRLVRESLRERETLLKMMPHIAWPMRFVLPLHPDMRPDTQTPAAKLVARLAPWLGGRRPAWMIRAGLFLYDHMGGRRILPATSALDLRHEPEGAALKPDYPRAYEYSDVWVDDARLVVLNARDAAARGARILTRSPVTGARVENGLWTVTMDTPQGPATVRARMLVNAAGPWVGQVLARTLGLNAPAQVRLVRGSHIITRRLFDHDKAYFLQGTDGRIIFAIPYEGDFTLIGTTDAEHADPDKPPRCTLAERDYLLAFANRYFATQVTADDVVRTYSGVRPLYDDGASSATAATRDYVLKLDQTAGAPVLHVFGGKITTYRKLAQAALQRIGAALPVPRGPWTAGAALPGGDFPHDGVPALLSDLIARHPFLTRPWALRLVRAYGTDARAILGTARRVQDLGRDFGGTLTEAELDWMVSREWAVTAEDALWRRSKLGLRLTPDQVRAVEDWLAARGADAAPAAGDAPPSQALGTS
jgi:glycerol-3-phosphate dehydrogenase